MGPCSQSRSILSTGYDGPGSSSISTPSPGVHAVSSSSWWGGAGGGLGTGLPLAARLPPSLCTALSSSPGTPPGCWTPGDGACIAPVRLTCAYHLGAQVLPQSRSGATSWRLLGTADTKSRPGAGSPLLAPGTSCEGSEPRQVTGTHSGAELQLSPSMA